MNAVPAAAEAGRPSPEDGEAESASSASPWDDAVLAAQLLAADPAGTGVWLRAPAGPVRDQWLALLQALLAQREHPVPLRRLPLHVRDERLLGGLDLAATLQAGRPVAQRGLLAEAHGGIVLVAMAERVDAATAARLGQVLDRGEIAMQRDGVALQHPARFGLVLLDEGADDTEIAPAVLRERVAMVLDLTAVSPGRAMDTDVQALAVDADMAGAAGRRVTLDDELLSSLCMAAAALGVASPRAVLQALAVARAHAALCQRDAVEAGDAAVAARLVLGPRATQLPAAPPAEQPPEPPAEPPPEDPPAEPPPPDPADPAAPPPPPPPPDDAEPPPPPPDPPADETQVEMPPAEMLLEAALAALPPDLLLRLSRGAGGREPARAAGKAGAQQQGGRRGRPAGVRRGEPRGGQRLSVIDTLRAAAPWQRVRRAASALAAAERAQAAAAAGVPDRVLPVRRIEVRSEDFHVQKLRQNRETTTIFAVDASGSSALNRLAEAKGAVELLLADCYVRRDRVALLAFRGAAAQLLLPPTRSLVRAKRSLASLPGGGGTPLASAVAQAADLAEAAQRRGETPLVVLLTDGRGNVGLDGRGGRAQAEQDALQQATRLRLVGCAVLLIDTSPTAQPAAARLAEAMRARYLPLPYADAMRLSKAVRAAAAE